MWDILGAVASGLGSYFAADAQKEAAKTAADAQMAANREALAAQQQQFGQALDFQRNQFDTNRAFQQGLLDQSAGLGEQQLGSLQSLFAPFVAAGGQGIEGLNQFAQTGLGGYQNALQSQQALAGALGPDAQAAAIQGIQSGPLFGSLARQGEDAILQNASATGGLRGGNAQAALAQFRPNLLNQLIQQQFSNLGGIAGLGAQGAQGFGALGQLGQAGAAGQAQGGLGVLQSRLGLAGQVGSNVGQASGQLASNVGALSGANSSAIMNLLGQQGAIGAGNALAQGQANANMFNGLGSQISLQSLINQLQQRGGLAGIGASPSAGLSATPSYSLGNPNIFASFGFGGQS
ncbi:MAG: hypothetical protein WC986_13645 [Elusimicrobiota bacterium]|jgi:hypothetical protein